MRLGGRFPVGHDFSSIVPPGTLLRIAECEAQLSPEEAQSKRWTLTWLEGQPVLELDGGQRIGPNESDDV